MFFVVRDDDTSFFTSPEELESVYGSIWDEIPISLAVIPCDVPSYHRGIQEKFYQEPNPVSIESNPALVEFLRRGVEVSRFNIMLHGYNHLYRVQPASHNGLQRRIPEFVYADNLEQKLIEGKTLLERLFATHISIFVPPSNAITARGLQAVGLVGLDLCGTAGGIGALLNANPLNAIRLVRVRLDPQYPYNVRRYVGYKQIRCHSLTPTCDWDWLCRWLEECKMKKGIFVVATHYWEMERCHCQQGCPQKELFFELIQRARKSGFHFVSAEVALR